MNSTLPKRDDGCQNPVDCSCRRARQLPFVTPLNSGSRFVSLSATLCVSHPWVI